MKEEIEKIREHYNADPETEWNRIEKVHPYEKYITTHMMERYLKPQSKILDVGGGPGQYSIHFAKKGHEVTLLDLSDGNVALAKQKAQELGATITAVQGNALDLSDYADKSFDAVFLMGPLYHLMEEENRIQALKEAVRVLKPNGFLFTSFILMFGGIIFGLRELEEAILYPSEKKWFEAAAKEESLASEGFTYVWSTSVKDAKGLIGKFPELKTETVFGQESILAPYKFVLEKSPREVQEAWFEYALRFCEKEEYLSHTEHLMIVSRKN